MIGMATAEPTSEPTAEPTPAPTAEPTPEPTAEPTPAPTAEPTPEPTAEPTPEPTAEPTPAPTAEPAGIRDMPPYETYQVGAPPPLPGVGKTYRDPTFGTQVMQITEAGGSHAYSYWKTFNLDSTKLYIMRDPAADGGPAFYSFNPEEFVLGDRLNTPGFARNCNGEDAMWSAVDPNVIHCHNQAGTILAYDVSTDMVTTIKDLGPEVPGTFQMTRSDDDKVFGFRLRDAEQYIGYVIYDRSTDDTQIFRDGNVDEIILDDSGQYIVEDKSAYDPGPSGIQNTVVDPASGKRTDLTNGAPCFAPGHHDTGTGTIIGHDDYENTLRTRDLDDPCASVPLLQWANYDQDYHVSLPTDGSMVLISAYGTHSGPLASEVFVVYPENCAVTDEPDSGCPIRHLAHTFSSERPSDYFLTPRASISGDGRFATYVSDWGGEAGHVFVAKIK
jgi:hypothetical protein